ncbi:1,4-alpha-glucan branching protein GlgB [Ferrovum myxofaciens]|jgi:1,4-alpha-glucan branching enzyme|uniref:1,4-alpha-glucan branching protein GlgB n=1 Tax=Ferrovum myxofaciens TaxID=416213 RepID=UPI0004E0BFD8|nr:1,4-alpha-glucan branching protein GlgB [Ferrovum myxofaciens]NDU88758.1 1,4-alpha-glucan branching protein GlgB [Ferrovum sp.]
MAPNYNDSALQKILQGLHHDPFHPLGIHASGHGKWHWRLFLPYAQEVEIWTGSQWETAQRVHDQGFFCWKGAICPPRPGRYRRREDGIEMETWDPYTYPPQLSDHDLYLFSEGRLLQLHAMLGAHHVTVGEVSGVLFSVWAPNAERVSVVGSFNRWDGRHHPMRVRAPHGVWELFVPDLTPGTLYKFEIRSRQHGSVQLKTDPCGLQFEHRPGTAAVVTGPSAHLWNDSAWMSERSKKDWLHSPMNIYEIHLGSWRKPWDRDFHTFAQIADQLIPYVLELGYTHIELLPISEHPLDESWGYQTTGYFGVTRRFGTPDDLRHFIDRCHQAGIGVLLDWVPGHFPKDDFALARFDGSALYEHEDPRLGEHQEWGTYIFNYGRNEVRGFLLANAHFWLSEFHFDGLRVDAVASMLYLDYSRAANAWIPNCYGGRENLEALAFLREMNEMVHGQFPGALTLAEESTSWPMVSRPVYVGGLGFSMKWNMGWMNDTLSYFSKDPVYRRHHQNALTFAQLYAYSENFVLPFSHDEVVHGKKSLLDKMPGDSWQRFANLRLLFLYQMTSPGKKLNFMGNEFAQGGEWQVKSELDWKLLERPQHQGIQHLSRDLNHYYRQHPALFELDFDPAGFEWVDCNDHAQSILSFLRKARDGRMLLIILNFTPIPRPEYRVGTPCAGSWRECVNSDSLHYGGGNLGNQGRLWTAPIPWNGFTQSLSLMLPPLGGLILEPQAH